MELLEWTFYLHYCFYSNFHIFWKCPAIQSYGLEVITEINLILGFEIDNSFGTIYLGNIPTNFNTQDYLKYYWLLIIIKKKNIFVENPPTKEEWIVTVKYMYDKEKLAFSLRLNMDTFYKLMYRSLDKKYGYIVSVLQYVCCFLVRLFSALPHSYCTLYGLWWDLEPFIDKYSPGNFLFSFSLCCDYCESNPWYEVNCIWTT